MASKQKKMKAKPVAKKATKKAAKKVIKKAAAKKPVKKVAKKIVKKAGPKKKTPVKKAAPKKVVSKKPTVIAKPTKAQPAKNVDYSKAITPIADRIVVRVDSLERVTSGGLIIPNTVSQATGFLKATVLAVGAGGTNKKGMLRPLDVKVGDTVLFAEHSGTKVQFNSEDLQIIHEYDVMGIVQ